MVAEPWLLRMGNQVSSNIKNSLFLNQNQNQNQNQKKEKQTIGILSFEVANVMSKLVHLHKSVSDEEISKLKNEIIKSEGVNKLVSSDEYYLLELAFAERIDDLNNIAQVVSRLGNKCTHPALLGFQHVYADVTCGNIPVFDLGFLVKDMDSMIRKMEKYVASTANLYAQLEVLNHLELATNKLHQNHNHVSRRALHQKLSWQHQDVSHLRDLSLWNLTFDKVVELLARTVCTLYARICMAFGNNNNNNNISLIRTRTTSPSTTTNTSKKPDHKKPHPNFKSQLSFHKAELHLFQRQDLLYPCAPSPARVFMECLSLASSASTLDNDQLHHNKDPLIHSYPSQLGLHYPYSYPNNHDRPQLHSSINASRFPPKSRLATYATPSTVGGSALALHYANVIIVIEKLLRYPHLVGEEARDDLYQMLPSTLRNSLRIKLKSNFKNFAIFDGALAHDWKENLDHILNWLAPLAHNMIRWQSERNFEQQQIVTRTNALLLQTLYFADREKTESAVCDLLVGLNYICRYEHQQNALLDCASSFDFGDWMEWQLQCQASCFD